MIPGQPADADELADCLGSDDAALAPFFTIVTETTDTNRKRITLSGEIETLDPEDDENDVAEILDAFANDENKAWDDFEALYDLASGTWGFTTVTIGDQIFAVLRGALIKASILQFS